MHCPPSLLYYLLFIMSFMKVNTHLLHRIHHVIKAQREGRGGGRKGGGVRGLTPEGYYVGCACHMCCYLS